MPHENIRDPHHAEMSLRIGWNGEAGYVQVATLNLDVYQEASGDPAGGWFMNLDRHAINKAISTLRRARDAAYGKDE